MTEMVDDVEGGAMPFSEERMSEGGLPDGESESQAQEKSRKRSEIGRANSANFSPEKFFTFLPATYKKILRDIIHSSQ